LNIRHKIDGQGRVALVERERGFAIQAHVVDRGDLENCENNNHQSNDGQQKEKEEAASEPATGGPDARKAGQTFRPWSLLLQRLVFVAVALHTARPTVAAATPVLLG